MQLAKISEAVWRSFCGAFAPPHPRTAYPIAPISPSSRRLFPLPLAAYFPHSSRGATDSSAPDSRQDQCSTEELAESHLWWSSAQLALDFRGRLEKLLRCFAPPPLPPATYPIAPISPPPPPPLSPLIPPSPSRASARFC